MEGQYSGVDILEALESADNYNSYLTGLICKARNSTELVDFGAGSGTFAKRLRHTGCRVICIEPDSLQRQRLVAQGFEAFATIDLFPDDSVAFLFSLNVLEHIKDDWRAMRQIYRKLQPGGFLFVYVPAFQCLWSSLDDKVCHCRRYTKKSLRRLAKEAGFEIHKLQYADSLGFIAALTFRLLRKKPEALTARSIRFYDRWVFLPSRLLDLVFHRFFGKNVIMICRK
jgi:SAM-dependent methyltransferase